MSWWDASGISGLATQALKKAQKGIDKVLDINEEGGAGSSTKDVRSKTPDNSSDEQSTPQEGGDFFNAWLAPKETPTEAADKPKKSRTLAGAKKLSGDSRPTSSSSLSDADGKDPKRKISSGSDSAFKTVSSQEPTTGSGSMFEELHVDTSRGDEDVFKQFDMAPEKKADVSVSMLQEMEYSQSLSLQAKDSDFETKTEKEIPDQPEQPLVSKSEKRKGPLKLGGESKETDKTKPPETDSVTKDSDDNDSKGSVEDIPKEEGSTSLLSVAVPDPFAAADTGPSDWSDMSLSLLTESQMSAGSGKSAETETPDFVASDIKNDDIESTPVAEDTNSKEEVPVKESQDLKDTAEVLHEVPEDDADKYPEESESDPETSQEVISEPPESRLMANSKTSISTVEDSMEGSHGSGDLSDSNRTITAADDVESDLDEDDEPPDADHSCETEAKDTDSGRDRSSSIQSITEPSSSPQDHSPDSNRSQLSEPRKEGEMSSSGYVKNMLEEAMVESQKDTDSHADSSDLVRIESGHNSGHTSADEIETQTSSDIEIISHISTPNSNGDYRFDRPFDLSPLRHALGRSMTRRNSPPHHGHHRTDSGSSGMSFQSGNGHDVTSPPGMMRHPEPPFPSHDRLAAEAAASNNPLETEKLLKKLAEMAEALDAREKKLFEMSKENMELGETNSVLRNLLKQAEEARESDQTDLHALTEEFTKRIAEAEKRNHQSQKEKESMKKRATELEMEVRNRSDTSTATERIIKEKDEQIAELLEEGEKLSKQQLQSNNIIKKLRAKEKENDQTIKSQRDKVDSQKAEIERLQKILDNKCDIEQKQIDAINQLNNMVKKQEKEIERLKTEVEEYQEKARSSQNALDSSYKEIAELHRAAAAAQSEQTQAALSAEMQAKQQLQIQLDNAMIQARNEQEALITQIEDLRLSVSRQEKEHGRREDILRQEISDLQQRLQEGEDRNHELTASVSGATRPLLRQIENLQSTYTAQSASYEKIEKNLTERLAEAQQQASVAVAKEREAAEQLREQSARLTTLETQCAQLRQEKAKHLALLEMERTKIDMLTDAKNNEVAQLEAQKHQLDEDNQELRKERLMLESQLEMERMKVDSEKKRVMLVHEQLRDKELQLSQVPIMTSSTVSTAGAAPDSTTAAGSSDPMLSSMTGSMHSSMSGSVMSQDDLLERALMQGGSNSNSLSRLNLYESLRQAGATTVLENLQSQLKQREGEVQQLQSEISELEKTREAMARELVNLSNQNDDLQAQLKDFPTFKQEYKDLNERYNAMLQMYGEKVEEADELRLDLQDVKDMYKGQIEELLKQYTS